MRVEPSANSQQREDTFGPWRLGQAIADSTTHGIGAALSLVGLPLLILRAGADGRRLAGALVFGFSLVLLYGISTAYHIVWHLRARRILQRLDHAGIHILIAGTYTPFSLITLRDAGGVWLLAAIWSLAIVGIVIELRWPHRPEWLGLSLYLVMGWLVLFVGGDIHQLMSTAGFALLAAGGVAYTAGTVFYALSRVPYMHMVWHLFVLAGSTCHFLAVELDVLRA